MRVGVGAQVEPAFADLEPLRLDRNRALLDQEALDRVEGLRHVDPALCEVEPHHVGVRGEGARTDAEDDTASGQVVEVDHAVGYQEGVVVGQRDHARAELDALRALGRSGDKDLGRRDRLVAIAVMLTHPRLVVAELVQPLDQLDVAPDGERRVLRRVVQRPDEAAEAEWRVHVVKYSFVSARAGGGEWGLHPNGGSHIQI